jgi:hypothetical protein
MTTTTIAITTAANKPAAASLRLRTCRAVGVARMREGCRAAC